MDLCQNININITVMLVITIFFLLIFIIYITLLYGKIETFTSLNDLRMTDNLRKKINVLEEQLLQKSLFDLYDKKIKKNNINNYNWINEKYKYFDDQKDLRKFVYDEIMTDNDKNYLNNSSKLKQTYPEQIYQEINPNFTYENIFNFS